MTHGSLLLIVFSCFFYVGIDYYHRSSSSQAILEPKSKLDAELGTEEERTLIIGYISLTASAMIFFLKCDASFDNDGDATS